MRTDFLHSRTIAAAALAALIAAGGLSAQETGGTVLGFVYDASTGNAIPQVQVELAGPATITAVTTIEGSYTIDGVPPGTYKATFQSPHYQAVAVEGLVVVAGEMIDGSTVMSSTSEKTVVDVVAEIAPAVATAEAMLVERRLSSTVSDTIGAEEIKGGMSSDAAEALEKVTGVTTMNDFVYVRGLDPRYSATTLNNAMLATTEPERRVVPLDLFPANLINNIKVLKTYSPTCRESFRPAWCRSRPPSFLPSRPSASATRSASTTKRRAAHGSTTPAAAGTFSASTTARARCPPRSPPIRAWTASTFPAASCKSSADSSRRTGSARRAT